MKRWLISLSAALLVASSAGAEDAPASAPAPKPVARETLPIPAPVKESKEYYDGVVLLVDHAGGWLGVAVYDEETDAESKLSFRADPENVYVTNRLNHDLEFSALQVGDHVDLYTEPGRDGRETVTEIVAYDRYEEE